MFSDQVCFFFFQAEDGIRDLTVTGVQTCALPISAQFHPLPGRAARFDERAARGGGGSRCSRRRRHGIRGPRSEEHTSELQSQSNLVCRLLLEKKKNIRAPAGYGRTPGLRSVVASA